MEYLTEYSLTTISPIDNKVNFNFIVHLHVMLSFTFTIFFNLIVASLLSKNILYWVGFNSNLRKVSTLDHGKKIIHSKDA